jgi:hypothetical protein
LPNRLERLRHKPFAAGPIENVGLDWCALSSQFSDFGGNLGKIGTTRTVVDDEIGALTGQLERTALANSSTSARYQGDFPGMPHGPSLQPSQEPEKQRDQCLTGRQAAEIVVALARNSMKLAPVRERN